MVISYEWIKRYVPGLDADPAEFVSRMTMSGSKVETYSEEAPGLSGIKAGKVLEMEKHPDADHLWICKVDVGGSVLQIVTGAQNVNVGDMVPVALVGAELGKGKKIEKAVLKGVESDGMMCSLGELGLTQRDYPDCIEDGIMMLPERAKPGDDVKKLLGLSDIIIDFEITPNRPDCLGAEGISREAAATFDLPFDFPEAKVKKTTGNAGDLLSVRIDCPDRCYRYTGGMVKNVRIKPSPEWMRRLLRQSGVRPINNIVDITNFVMLEYNQPMHAFDSRFVEDDQIIVRCAKEGEKLTTLDGTSRDLDSSMTVIADPHKVLALAGIMGGEYTGIMDDTNTVIFESAMFNGVTTRLTAQKLGMRTEASSRYEKGLDPHNTKRALMRALQLVEELDAGDVIGGVVDAVGTIKEPEPIYLDPDRVNRFLGTDISTDFMVKTLKKLEFKVDKDLMVTAPTFRGDVEGFADLSEEVARFYGYDKIPITVTENSVAARQSPEYRFKYFVRELCFAGGFHEINTFSFMNPAVLDKMGVPDGDPMRNAVKIKNPFGPETSLMRTSMVPSLLTAMSANAAARVPAVKMFEIARIYLPGPDENKLPDERNMLSACAYGGRSDFFTLKGLLETVLARVGISGEKYERMPERPWMHPGRSAVVTLNGEKIAELGEIHPDTAKAFGIKERAIVMSADLNRIYEASDMNRRFSPLPRFPETTRDLALECDIDTPNDVIEGIIRDSIGDILEKITVFDVYTGENIPEGKKSIAYSLVMRSPDSTLKDEQVDEAIEKALGELSKIGVEIRK
ncbi:MAG: phenylalanine--tRNA ligase subunit beta [Oscillospiraceae bacterium]|jgi:phenylalanyl-tRNA synthetase beta chain